MKIISIADCFVKQKHYSHTPSIFWAAFGLVIDDKIQGVCVYGQPSPPIQKYAFKDRNFRLYELSRLVIQTQEKNAASFLVGNSLKLLEKHSAVISYADTAMQHCGIVYQATNWIYTGMVQGHDKQYLVDGKWIHGMTLKDRFNATDQVRYAKENNIQYHKQSKKHRYFYLNGNKMQKKSMLENLSYKIVQEYPKCDKVMYDSGENLEIYAPQNIFDII